MAAKKREKRSRTTKILGSWLIEMWIAVEAAALSKAPRTAGRKKFLVRPTRVIRNPEESTLPQNGF
jgi:hypothetical protein